MSQTPKTHGRGTSFASASSVERPQEMQSTPDAAEVVVKCRGWPDWKLVGLCAGLAILVFAVFGQTLRYDFVNYDDNFYVYENPEVIGEMTACNVARAFTRKEMGLWNPLVTVSHMLDCRFYGLKPGWHHLVNVLLHLVSVILLFLILRQMTGALLRSAFVATVFAIHPLKVESVAWISERKDVLSGLFFMLTLAAYLRYVRRPGSVSRYLWVVTLFSFGLMCKPMVVTLPLVLVLLDYWPLKRLFAERLSRPEDSEGFSVNWRAVAEKLPLLVLSIGLGAVTIAGGKGAASIGVEPIPFWTRMAEAPVWMATYLWQSIWPTGMTVVYTHPEAGLPWWPAAMALCVAVSVGTFLLRKEHPYLWMGWLWNVGMLVPASGILQISRHARADHYNYLPQIGLCLALTWAAADWAGQWRHRRIGLWGVAAAALCVLSVVAWNQTSYWRDSEALWTHALSCTQDNSVAHNDLGNAIVQKGRNEEAIVHYREALRIRPNFLEAHYNLGNALLKQGRKQEAIGHFREALKINPDYEEAHNSLGNALLQQGRLEEAIGEFNEVLRINPASFEACSNLGEPLLQLGRTEEAIVHYREALRINPTFEGGHYNLGNALLQQGRTEEAIAQFREAVRINPNHEKTHNNLGNLLLQQGRMEEAIVEYREALRINPKYEMAYNNLGEALSRQGHVEEAIAQYREALQINPASLEANYNLWLKLLKQGRTREALAYAQIALRLAETQSDSAFADKLRRQLELYQTDRRLEDSR